MGGGEGEGERGGEGKRKGEEVKKEVREEVRQNRLTLNSSPIFKKEPRSSNASANKLNRS